jgi:ATP synthase protein I
MRGTEGTGGPRKDKPSGEEEWPEPQVREQEKRQDELARELGAAEKRKVRARERGKEESVWFGLGTFGLVGWSVAIPTLIGLALGIWLDRVLPLGFSWTLTLLFVGIIIGCINAWYWITRERIEIDELRADLEEEAENTLRTNQEDEDGD